MQTFEWKGETLSDLERSVITDAFNAMDGNIVRTARALNIGRATLYRKLKEYGLYPRKKSVGIDQLRKSLISSKVTSDDRSE